MRQVIGRHLTLANVTSVIALFIALGGAGYAAVQLPRNSVGGDQLRRSAVTGAKIRDGAVASRDLAKSVRAQLARTGRTGPPGTAGSPGAKGDAGASGQPGPPGAVAGLERHLDSPPGLVTNGGEQTIITLNSVPPGSYVLFAKVRMGSITGGTAFCYLRAGADFDRTVSKLTGLDSVSMSFALAHTFATTGTATMSCDPGSDPLGPADAKITAVQVSTLTKNAS